jgi:hypothetical protein
MAFVATVAPILNSDYQSRTSTTESLGILNTYTLAPNARVTVQLVLHNAEPTQNYCEVQAFISADDSYVRGSNPGTTPHQLRLTIQDASGIQPMELATIAELTAKDSLSGKGAAYSLAASSSPIFRLPGYSSMVGFPFDSIAIRPMVTVKDQDGVNYPFELNVQKGFPGRLIVTRMDEGGFPLIEVRRSWIEKLYYCLIGSVFVVVTVSVAWKLTRLRAKPKRFEEILATAGFLVAAAGLKSSMGIPQSGGLTLFEALVFGVPFLFLTIGFLYRTFNTSKVK